MAALAFHYAEAEKLLIEGAKTVQSISEIDDERNALGHDTGNAYVALTRCMDELGKKAMGIWAQAQVHATLATADYDTPREARDRDA